MLKSENTIPETEKLPESEFKYGLLGIAAHQFNAAVVVSHNLAGN